MLRFLCETRTGRLHGENQDRVIAREIVDDGECFLIAVADGISKCPFGGSVARWLVNQHLAHDDISIPDVEFADLAVHTYLEQLHAEFRVEFSDVPEMLKSGACLSLAVHREGKTHAYWVGDSPIYETTRVNDRYSTRLVSKPDSSGVTGVTDFFGGTSPCQIKHVQLHPDTHIVTITSDGAIHDAHLLNRSYQLHGFSQRVADEVCQEAHANANADDVSIVAMRLNMRADCLD